MDYKELVQLDFLKERDRERQREREREREKGIKNILLSLGVVQGQNSVLLSKRLTKNFLLKKKN